MGGDLGGLGDGPPKFGVGTANASVSPNISRSSVIGCVWKYELSKKRCHEEIFCSEIEVFRKQKGHKNVIYQISDSKEGQKT